MPEGHLQMQETREAINACLMYLYQAHRNQGADDLHAKEAVAAEITNLLQQWSDVTGLTLQAGPATNPMKLLDELVQTAAAEAAAGQPVWTAVYRKLVDLRTLAVEAC